jgi:biopolymer transport protein ExbB
MKLPIRASILSAAALFRLPGFLAAQTAAETAPDAAAAEPAEEMTIDWIQEIVNGGMTSAVLLLLSAAAIGFLVERLVRMRRKFLAPAYYADFFADAIAKNDDDAIRKEAESKPSILADAGAYIVDHPGMDEARLQTAVADAAARAVERHRQRSYPLAIIATMAPMLGLLGTVIGMIEAFSKVAILGDTGDAALLADSISKALITTDIGLVLAIPSLGAYHYLKQKLSIAELAIEEALEAMFAALDARKK